MTSMVRLWCGVGLLALLGMGCGEGSQCEQLTSRICDRAVKCPKGGLGYCQLAADGRSGDLTDCYDSASECKKTFRLVCDIDQLEFTNPDTCKQDLVAATCDPNEGLLIPPSCTVRKPPPER